ncbi:BREX system Lon protease-like protein BrxL [Candidatus Methanodesulfokora washburnensis]|uniref:BREX system Lon protease-like protein BrxL n=1 Tax=Candidatus Methanodesulfokora washburnensis TaxID=2478471 RepID=A0A3R9PF66_9CREN|nr:BREX system Lon protease-like protein BrxL [Candidatus Methanodesulfokores washburnensis]RSN72766.1 BREX system Lon protease-like protein BrxL [Candidatus Methanodesulfokores washburnensis]
MSLDQKLLSTFPEEVVNKRLSRMDQVSRLPRFISEYVIKSLVGDNPKPEDIVKLSDFISRYYPEPKERDRVLNDLISRGEYKLIDEFKVTVDPKRAKRKAEIPSLRVYDAKILPSVLEEHKDMLGTGMWGIATLIYEPSLAEDPSETPITITEFKPLQYAGINLKKYKEGRKNFSTEEWIDILMNTVGVNPDVYTNRQKLLYLTRLVPLIENNVNLIELGPRATGKSFVYKNISYYVRLYSGGTISPAVLFFHGTLKILGDLGTRDCVVFDEVSKIRFSNPDEMMGKLKDYMESGEFERGLAKRVRSTCSLVFMGNIEVEGFKPAEDFAEILPTMMLDSAFIDRIHGIIPGWELPKIEQADIHLSNGYGFISDYFCEVLHRLRRESFSPILSERVKLYAEGGKVTIRDQKAIMRIASGMMKLLFPHGSYSDDELRMIMDLSVEYRQRVHDWLIKLSPGEFEKKTLKYEVIG